MSRTLPNGARDREAGCPWGGGNIGELGEERTEAEATDPRGIPSVPDALPGAGEEVRPIDLAMQTTTSALRSNSSSSQGGLTGWPLWLSDGACPCPCV